MENTTPVVTEKERVETVETSVAAASPDAATTPVAPADPVVETAAVHTETVAETTDAAATAADATAPVNADAPAEPAVSEDHFADPAPMPAAAVAANSGDAPANTADAEPVAAQAAAVATNEDAAAGAGVTTHTEAGEEATNESADAGTNQKNDPQANKGKQSTWRRICCCCCGDKNTDTQAGESSEATQVTEDEMENTKADICIEGAVTRIDMLGRSKNVWMRVRVDGTVEIGKSADDKEPTVNQMSGESVYEKTEKHKKPAIKVKRSKNFAKALAGTVVFVFETEEMRDTWIAKLTELRNKLFPAATPAPADAADAAAPADAAAAPAADGNADVAKAADTDKAASPAAAASSGNVSAAASGKAAQ